MFEYGALLNKCHGEQLQYSWQNLLNALEGVPLHWMAIALVLLFLFARFLKKK